MRASAKKKFASSGRILRSSVQAALQMRTSGVFASFANAWRLHRTRAKPGPELQEQQRTIGFEHRISIVFRVYDDQKLVRITGIRYAGRNLQPWKE